MNLYNLERENSEDESKAAHILLSDDNIIKACARNISECLERKL